jgi:hypothetical protein
MAKQFYRSGLYEDVLRILLKPEETKTQFIMNTESCISRNHVLFSLLTAVIMVMMSVSLLTVNGQTITTDKVDYMPGDTVTVSGTGWRTNESVDLVLTELELLDTAWVDVTKTIECDAFGNFLDQVYIVVNADLGAFFHITATGLTSEHVATITFNDGGHDYAIDFSAYNPQIYTRQTPATVPAPSSGRVVTNPLGQTNHNQTVESLMPKNLGLGQIVSFEFYIRVDACSPCQNDMMKFKARFSTVTTNNNAFGFDPSYMVYAAFVDATPGGGIDDPDGDATVTSFTEVNSPASGYFEGTINVAGLDPGDEIPVEVWVILQSSFPTGAGGNVHSSLRNASTTGTCEGNQTICTGTQTIPLMQVGGFDCTDVDLSITKSDNIDPVTICNQLVYTINVSNAGRCCDGCSGC